MAGIAELVPEAPSSLGLPHSEWRDYQRETVGRIIEGFEDGCKVLLSAPTGSGKTVLGSAAARVFQGTSMFLAHTIHLQQQQLRTLPDAKTATGRANHICPLPDPFGQELTAAEAPCPCEMARADGCSYYNQLFKCGDAQEAVLNYAYAVRVFKARGMKVYAVDPETGRDVVRNLPNPFNSRDVLVCDEAHLLERALIDVDTIEVNRRTFEQLHIELPAVLSLSSWRAWAQENEARVSAGVADIMRAFVKTEHPHRDDIRAAKRLQSAWNVITGVLSISPSVPYYIGRTPLGFTIQPLWAWSTAHNLLWKYGKQVLIMSATIGDPELTTRLLGIEDWRYIEVPSTFPVVNRPVFYWPVMKMSVNTTDWDRFQQVHALAHLATKFPTSAGVVHCCSYDLGRFLYDNAGIYPDLAARLVIHDAKTREVVFQDFETRPGNRILITPAATTGVDWGFVGWQMIPKVPFPNLGDDIVRLRYNYVDEEGEEIGKRVFLQEAALAVVQAAGRCVRTPTDKGVTIITDANFWRLFEHTSRASFPEWFRSAVSWYHPTEAA
jgi:Rad3-related DNA helicase